MVEAYTIASRLTFTSNGPQIVADLIKQFERLDRLVGSAQGSVGKLAAEMRTLNSGSRGIGAAVKAMEGFGKVRLGPGLIGDMERVTTAAREFAAVQRDLAKSAAETAAAWRQMGRTPPRGPGVPGGAPARSGGASSHHDLLNTSMGLTMAGDAGTGIFGKAIMAEMQVSQQLASLRMNTTLSDSDIAMARAAAEKATRSTPGTTLAENLHHLVDAFTVTGDLNEAMAGLPAVSRMAYVLANLPGAHKGDTSFAGMQAIEVMQRYYDPTTHHISMEAFNQQLAAMTKVAVGTGGRVDGSSYLGFAKQARVGGMVHNDDFLYRDLPALLISLGGNRAGTGDAAVWNQFVTGKMTANAFGALRGSGLIDSKAKWKGGQVGNMLDHLRNGKLFAENPVEWVRQELLGDHGALREKGIDPHDRLAVSKYLSSWASRQTGLGFLSELALGMEGVDKEGQKIGQTTNDPMKTLQSYDPMQKIREFHAAENELLVTLGKDAMGPALEALKGLTSVIRELAEYGKAHPDAAKNLVLVGGGLAVLAKGAGEAALVLYLGAPLIRGLGALAGAALPFGAGAPAGAALATLGGAGVGSLAALGAAAIGLVATLAWVGKDLLGLQRNGVDQRGSQQHPPAGSTGSEWGPLGDWMGGWWNGFKAAPGAAGPHPRDLRHPSSYLGPSGGGQPPIHVALQVDGKIDGQTLLRFVSSGIARSGAGPSTGTTGPDLRVGTFGGMAGAAA